MHLYLLKLFLYLSFAKLLGFFIMLLKRFVGLLFFSHSLKAKACKERDGICKCLFYICARDLESGFLSDMTLYHLEAIKCYFS